MRVRLFLSIFCLLIGFCGGVFIVYSFTRPVSQNAVFSWAGLFVDQSGDFSFDRAVDVPTEISFLTGAVVPQQSTFVAGVMIDNHPDARPQQTGLSKASIVYEAIAEGGITRYLAIVSLDGTVSMIGPMRSARPYFIDWASEYDGFYVHAGGSDTALNNLLSNSAVYNVDGLEWEEVSFASKGMVVPAVLRSATDFLVNRLSVLGGLALEQPHNLFLDLVYLRFFGDFIQPSAGRSFAPSESHFLFGDGVFPSDAAVVSSFSIDFSFPSYFVNYVYDQTTGLYNRFLAQKSAKDLLGSIQPKNVIVLLTPAVQVDDYGRLEMDTKSGGKAWIFTGGMMTPAQWQYDSTVHRTRFFDADGTEVSLQPGQTWVEVINREESLSFPRSSD